MTVFPLKHVNGNPLGFATTLVGLWISGMAFVLATSYTSISVVLLVCRKMLRMSLAERARVLWVTEELQHRAYGGEGS